MDRIIHFEIPAKNPAGLQKFYSGVFGWKFDKWDGPTDYWMIKTGDDGNPGINGGMDQNSGRVRSVVDIVDVKDLDSTIKKIESMGGKITIPKRAVPGMGWMVYFQDPDGNVFGAFEENTKAQ